MYMYICTSLCLCIEKYFKACKNLYLFYFFVNNCIKTFSFLNLYALYIHQTYIKI